MELKLNKYTHFVHNVLSEKITDPKLVRKVFLTCSLAWKMHCHTLFDGWITRCSRLPFLDLRLNHTGLINNSLLKQDGLRITDTEDFPERLRRYMETDEPLTSCQYCIGSVGKRFVHAQLSKEEIQRESWREVPLAGNIDWFKLYRRLIKRKLLGRI